jgi:hypothetical protein
MASAGSTSSLETCTEFSGACAKPRLFVCRLFHLTPSPQMQLQFEAGRCDSRTHEFTPTSLERTDYDLARIWFQATNGNRWPEEWDQANVVIRYPDTFDVTICGDPRAGASGDEPGHAARV